jgi:putative addiction module component (TIGR02574 family)
MHGPERPFTMLTRDVNRLVPGPQCAIISVGGTGLGGRMGKEIRTADILGLPVDERLRLVQEIWDSLATNPSSVPFPDWHRSELEERLARHNADPNEVEPWDEVRARLSRPVKKKRSTS